MGGRIDKAIPIVLAGAIELLSDGRAIVGAQSQAVRQDVVNGTIVRMQSGLTLNPGGQPKIAVCILKQAEPLARQKCYDVMASEKAKHHSPLPEAPASVNGDVDVAGRNVRHPT
jgi:hypothetical protein